MFSQVLLRVVYTVLGIVIGINLVLYGVIV